MPTYSLDLERDSSQYAYRLDTASLSITGDLTFESWVKLESTSGDILSKFETGTDKRSYRFTITAGGTIQIWVSSDGTAANTTSAASTTTIPIVIWTHVAVSYNAAAGTCQFYKNGAYLSGEDGSSLKTSIHDNNSQFALGAYDTVSGAAALFDGKLFEVRVWNDIRTAAEISAGYRVKMIGTESGLVGCWRLNNNYLDQTANDNDLTASGSPVFSLDVPVVFASPLPTHFQ